MTKKVRVENADTSDYKVVVQIWQEGAGDIPDQMIEERFLLNPADLGEFTLWSGRYLKIKETTR